MVSKRGRGKAARGGKASASRPEINPTVSAATAADIHTSSSSESEEGENNLGVITRSSIGIQKIIFYGHLSY